MAIAEVGMQAMDPDAAILAQGTVGDLLAQHRAAKSTGLLKVLSGHEQGSLFLVGGGLVDAEIRTDPGERLTLDGPAAAAQMLGWVLRFSFYFSVPSVSARPVRIGGPEDMPAQPTAAQLAPPALASAVQPLVAPAPSTPIDLPLTPPSSPPAGPITFGDLAPDFTLSDQDGTTLRLWDLVGTRNIVLYFYPKDHTPGSAKDACAFRDSYEAFQSLGAAVIGISPDSARSHDRLTAKHGLPFPLLADSGGAVRRLYGVPTTLGILPGRATYVIDRLGRVRHTFSAHFGAARHVRNALQVLLELAG